MMAIPVVEEQRTFGPKRGLLLVIVVMQFAKGRQQEGALLFATKKEQ